MLAASNELSISDVTTLVSESPYSRLPVYNATIDNIIGIVHLRDLFCWNNTLGDTQNGHISDIIRPVLYVPESMQVKEVFRLLQKKQFQVAIVLDEFGGTSGMVTLEDLIEEIFGDLRDEFDPDRPAIQIHSDTELLILGDTPIQEINNLLGISLPSEDVDTLGGLLSDLIGRIPISDDVVTINGFNFNIHKMRGRAVASVIMTATEEIVNTFRVMQ